MVNISEIFHAIIDNMNNIGVEYPHLTDEGLIKRTSMVYPLSDARTKEVVYIKVNSEIKASDGNKYIEIIYIGSNAKSIKDKEVLSGDKLKGTYKIKINYEKVVVDNPITKEASTMMTIDSKYFRVSHKDKKCEWKKIKNHDDKIAVLNESILRIIKSSSVFNK